MCSTAICDRAFIGDDPLPRSEQAFAEQVKRAKTRLPAVAESAHRLLADDRRRVPGAVAAARGAAARAQPLRGGHPRAARCPRPPGLLRADAVGATFSMLPRYLKALERRVAKYLESPDRDARHAQRWRHCGSAIANGPSATARPGGSSPALAEFRWLLEELKVSLFAQELKTPFPVSYKRVEKAWAELDAVTALRRAAMAPPQCRVLQ